MPAGLGMFRIATSSTSPADSRVASEREREGEREREREGGTEPHKIGVITLGHFYYGSVLARAA